LFSYTDTQLIRLGGPNFHEIPINRTIAPMHNNQRNGLHRHEVNVGRVAYFPNSLANGSPYQATEAEGGFVSHNERVEAHKVRARSTSFADHFSQAKLFFDSQTDVEQKHMIKALRFELGKVETTEIRVRMLGLLSLVDMNLAEAVAKGLGMNVPLKPLEQLNHGVPPNEYAANQQPELQRKSKTKSSDALSMLKNPTNSPTIATRRIAFVCADGVSEDSIMNLKEALKKQDACAFIVAPHLGFVKTDKGGEIPIDFSFFTASSVLFDGIFIMAGASDDLGNNADLIDFISDAYRHCKVIGADVLGKQFLETTQFASKITDDKELGLLVRNTPIDSKFAEDYINALAQHRFWAREDKL
jgi:catalase